MSEKLSKEVDELYDRLDRAGWDVLGHEPTEKEKTQDFHERIIARRKEILLATLEAAQNELEVQTTLAGQYESDGERLLSDLAASRKREEELERHRDELVKSRDHWQEEDKRHQRLLGEANKELAKLRVK